MQKDLAIEAKNLCKNYNLYKKPVHRLWETLLGFTKKSFHRTFSALKDVSFEVKKGECFGIIGKNGAGKSTLLKILTGVLFPTSGTMETCGNISALLELGAGFNVEYTGIENIYMNALVLGISKEEMDKKIPAILEFADIGDFVYQPVKLYSSGMFARLAFALQINVDPDILIVDEALSVGDIFFQAKCYKKFEEFKKKGKTVLFVTHDMTSVLTYCDRVMVMNEGQQVFVGQPNEAVNIFKKILANTFQPEEKEVKQEFIERQMEGVENKWMDKLPLNPNPAVYGNGDGDIVDFGIFSAAKKLTNTLDQFSSPTIKIIVKANKDIPNPIVAFKFKTTKSLELMGTNTMYEDCEMPSLKAGESMLVTFTFDIPLSPGEYLVDIGFTTFERDNLVVLNRLHEITTINVLSRKQNVGYVNPHAKVKVTKL